MAPTDGHGASLESLACAAGWWWHLRYRVGSCTNGSTGRMQYVAFLRGINLGKRRLKMERLRELFQAEGFADVGTFIASGNVLFESSARSATKLEVQIEVFLERELGYAVPTVIRTREDVAKIAAMRPFATAEMDRAEYNVNVGLMKSAPSSAAVRQLVAVKTDYDAFAVEDREFYWLARGPISQSTVWERSDVRSIALPAVTMRNLRTLVRLAETFPPRA